MIEYTHKFEFIFEEIEVKGELSTHPKEYIKFSDGTELTFIQYSKINRLFRAFFILAQVDQETKIEVVPKLGVE